MILLRWIAYLAFVLVYPLALIAVIWLNGGMGEPVCVREPDGCVGADWWRPYESVFLGIAALILTALAFVPYRGWIDRVTGAGTGKKVKP